MLSFPQLTASSPRAADPHGPELRNVWLAYEGVDALRDISLRIRPNTITAIAGPNGSGKSSLLSVLAGLQVPRRGTVHLPARLKTALVVQRSAVPDGLPLTVRDVVAMGRWARAGLWRPLRSHDRRIIEQCIALVGLTGYEGRNLRTLSGGQRQRAFLGQGLARQADLILLDEPTTGLDSDAQDRIVTILQSEKERGATVVCVSHEPSALAAADHVIRLEAGQLTAC